MEDESYDSVGASQELQLVVRLQVLQTLVYETRLAIEAITRLRQGTQEATQPIAPVPEPIVLPVVPVPSTVPPAAPVYIPPGVVRTPTSAPPRMVPKAIADALLRKLQHDVSCSYDELFVVASGVADPALSNQNVWGLIDEWLAWLRQIYWAWQDDTGRIFYAATTDMKPPPSDLTGAEKAARVKRFIRQRTMNCAREYLLAFMEEQVYSVIELNQLLIGADFRRSVVTMNFMDELLRIMQQHQELVRVPPHSWRLASYEVD